MPSPLHPSNDPMFEVVGICHKCKHYRPKSLSCKAFPAEVPPVILVGDFIHTKPYPGDHGIQFSLK